MIKLWIDKVGQDQISWEKLIKSANSTEAKAQIHNLWDLDQRYLLNKRFLKLIFKDSQGEHLKNVQFKAIATATISVSISRLIAQKESKKDRCIWSQERAHNQKASEGSTPVVGINTAKLGESNSKKKKNKDQTHLDRMAYNTSQAMC